MRLLFVHADRAAFEATTTADEGGAERDDAPLSGEMDDCVAAFVAVEAEDAAAVDAAVDGAADELRAAADRLNAAWIAMYPCPLLSDDAADAETTAAVLGAIEAALSGYEVLRAPAGWHLAFDVSCKGHPLSAFARRVRASRDGGARPPSERALLTPDGERRDPVDGGLDVGEELRSVIGHETAESGGTGRRDAGDGGRRWRAAARLADWGFVTDDDSVEGLHWTPRGAVVRDCLRAYVDDRAAALGASPVETPQFQDLGVRDVRVREDPDGDGGRYRVEADDRRYRLRASACAGHCALLRDAVGDVDDLPVSLYERDGRVFRRAARGPDEATVPEVHTAVADGTAALDAFERHAALARDAATDLRLAPAYVLRVTRSFHEGNEAWVEGLPATLGASALLEVYPEPSGDWAARLDAVTSAGDGPPVPLGTVALGDDTAERFGLTYADGDEERSPALVHCSPTGSLEALLGSLLAAADERDPPRLPTRLAPTQVRLIPVGEAHVDRCAAVAETLRAAGVRAGVDDRAATVGERIARADDDRVPYRAVVGDRELQRDALPVAERASGRETAMTVGELEASVGEDVARLPTRGRSLPALMSERAGFGHE